MEDKNQTAVVTTCVAALFIVSALVDGCVEVHRIRHQSQPTAQERYDLEATLSDLKVRVGDLEEYLDPRTL